MAIYHFSAKTVSRSDGRSSTAAAAYRSGERIVDERTGEIHDYTRKRGVVDGEVVLPGGGTMKRADLWNAVEQKHKRGDALVAREFELALPCELSDDQRRELTARYFAEIADQYGVAVDWNIHAPSHGVHEQHAPDHAAHDPRNFHVHGLMSACYVSADGVMGKKAVELDPIHCARAKILNPMETQRERWQVLVNEALATAGINARIDHRTLEAQGIDRAPGVHLGPEASAIERRGEESAIGLRARRQADEFMARVQADAVIRAAREKSVVELEAELAALKSLIEKREIPNVRYFSHEVTDFDGHEGGPKNGLRNLSECRLATSFGPADRAGVLQVDARISGRLPEQLRRESASAGSGGAGAGEHGPVGDAGEQPGADAAGASRASGVSDGRAGAGVGSALDESAQSAAGDGTGLVEDWRDDAHVNGLSGGQFMQPVALDLRDFRAEQAGRVVHYFDQAGRRAFTDNGRQIRVHAQSDEAVLAALQLAKQKWGDVNLVGGDEFKLRAVRLAQANGIKILNPELQDEITRLKAVAALAKAAAAKVAMEKPAGQPVQHVGMSTSPVKAAIAERTTINAGDGRRSEAELKEDRLKEAATAKAALAAKPTPVPAKPVPTPVPKGKVGLQVDIDRAAADLAALTRKAEALKVQHKALSAAGVKILDARKREPAMRAAFNEAKKQVTTIQRAIAGLEKMGAIDRRIAAMERVQGRGLGKMLMAATAPGAVMQTQLQAAQAKLAAMEARMNANLVVAKQATPEAQMAQIVAEHNAVREQWQAAEHAQAQAREALASFERAKAEAAAEAQRTAARERLNAAGPVAKHGHSGPIEYERPKG